MIGRGAGADTVMYMVEARVFSRVVVSRVHDQSSQAGLAFNSFLHFVISNLLTVSSGDTAKPSPQHFTASDPHNRLPNDPDVNTAIVEAHNLSECCGRTPLADGVTGLP